MRMAGVKGRLQQLAVLICVVLLAMTSRGDAVRCYDCQQCEKLWSVDEWKSSDCVNGTCGKRVVSGYTVDVGPFRSTNRFCSLDTDLFPGCKKRTLNERINGWLVKMSAVEECWCGTDYCNAVTTVSPARLTTCLLTALTSAWIWSVTV